MFPLFGASDHLLGQGNTILFLVGHVLKGEVGKPGMEAMRGQMEMSKNSGSLISVGRMNVVRGSNDTWCH